VLILAGLYCIGNSMCPSGGFVSRLQAPLPAFPGKEMQSRKGPKPYWEWGSKWFVQTEAAWIWLN